MTIIPIDRWDSEAGCSSNTDFTTIIQIQRPALVPPYSCNASEFFPLSILCSTTLQVLCLLDYGHSWRLFNPLRPPLVV
jgi:hypothetical protein